MWQKLKNVALERKKNSFSKHSDRQQQTLLKRSFIFTLIASISTFSIFLAASSPLASSGFSGSLN